MSPLLVVIIYPYATQILFICMCGGQGISTNIGLRLYAQIGIY